MPEVVIYLRTGRTLDQKRSLVAGLTEAVVNAIGSPAQNVVVTIVETAHDNKSRGGMLFVDRQPGAG